MPTVTAGRFGLVLLGALFICACSEDLYGRLPDPEEWTEPEAPPRLPDATVFAPKILNDTTEIRAYVAEFPREAYGIASISGLGQFYIDNEQDVIKSRLAKGEPWEKTVTERILDQIQPHSVALDVGAHIGTHSILMGQAVGPWGRVYAFEPQRKLFRELIQNIRLNGLDNVVPLRYALGSGPARIIEMNVAAKGNEGGTAVGTGGDLAELRSLDDFRFEDVSLIKIDVEGFEMEVLRGALETISRSRPVLIVEIHGANGTADEQARYRATQDYVRGLGYRAVYIRHADWLFLPEG